MPMGSEVFGVGRPVAAILQLRRIRKCPGGGVRGRRPRGRAAGPAGGRCFAPAKRRPPGHFLMCLNNEGNGQLGLKALYNGADIARKSLKAGKYRYT